MRERRNFTAEEKVKILKEHLIGREEISLICERHNLHPTIFYRWQKEFFENGAAAFAKEGKTDRKERRIEELEAKLKHKNGVIVELLEEHMILKKNLGES